MQTFQFGFSIDDDLIKENIDGKILRIADIFDVFKHRYNRVDYRPLSMLTFALEAYFSGGIHPAISHFINVLLFALIIVSSYFFTRFYLGESFQIESLFIVALFAVHPLCTEVVANIKSRDGLISMLCCIWSIYFFINAYRGIQFYKNLFLCWIIYAIGLFAKIDIVGMALFVSALYFIRFTLKDGLKAALLFGGFMLTYTFLREMLVNYFLPIDSSSDSTLAITTFTENPLAKVTGLFSAILGLIQTWVIYIQKIILPTDLHFYYGYNFYQLNTKIDLKVIIQFLSLTSCAAGIYFLSKKKDKIFIASIGSFVFIFFALNFMTPVAGIVADRYAFMSLLWFCMCFVLTLTYFSSIQKKSTIILLSAIILLFTFHSYNRTKAWKNLLTTIETDAPKLQNSYEGMRIASSVFYEAFNTTQDSSYLEKAIHAALQANKTYPENLLMNTQLGQYYFIKNDIKQAEAYLLKASKVDTTNATVFQYLGDVYFTKLDYTRAEKNYQKAYSLAKELQKQVLINNLSTVYYEQGLKEKVIDYNIRLIEQDSANFAAFENLGYFYLLKNDSMSAKKYFDFAVRHGMNKQGVPIFLQ
jgi:tetratricopeptide (TPR) repeat protein